MIQTITKQVATHAIVDALRVRGAHLTAVYDRGDFRSSGNHTPVHFNLRFNDMCSPGSDRVAEACALLVQKIEEDPQRQTVEFDLDMLKG